MAAAHPIDPATSTPTGDSLASLAETYAELRLIGAAPLTVRRLKYTVAHFADFLKHPPTLGDLNEENAGAFAHWMVKKLKLSTDTASGYHSKLLALWRFACRQDLLSVQPEQEKLKVPRRIPVAWSPTQLATLFAACERQTGHISGLPESMWWHTLHAVLWDTGERISAALSIEWRDINLDAGWLIVRAETRKGKGADKTWKLHPDTIAMLRQFELPRRRLVWPWYRPGKGHQCRHPVVPDQSEGDHAAPWDAPNPDGFALNNVILSYGKLLQAAGLPADRKHKFHCMRKSVASYFAAAGGNAAELLGHSDRRTTRTYLDPQIVKPLQASSVLFQPSEWLPDPKKGFSNV